MTGPRFDDPDVRAWVFENPRHMLTWAAHRDLPGKRAAKWNATAATWLAGCAVAAHMGGVSWRALATTAVAALICGAGVGIWLVSTAPAKTRRERARIAGLVAVDRPGIRVALAEEHAAYGCHERFGCHQGCRYGTAELAEVAA